MTLHPPPGWPQRRRTALPFPPGEGAAEFEIYMDRTFGGPWQEYQINLITLEAFERAGDHWSAPGWLQLPPRVRARIWTLWELR